MDTASVRGLKPLDTALMQLVWDSFVNSRMRDQAEKLNGAGGICDDGVTTWSHWPGHWNVYSPSFALTTPPAEFFTSPSVTHVVWPEMLAPDDSDTTPWVTCVDCAVTLLVMSSEPEPMTGTLDSCSSACTWILPLFVTPLPLGPLVSITWPVTVAVAPDEMASEPTGPNVSTDCMSVADLFAVAGEPSVSPFVSTSSDAACSMPLPDVVPESRFSWFGYTVACITVLPPLMVSTPTSDEV
mmetsp:Transcript_13628/g.42382  ORF Transcript_13628/g.42382 Transcript_13628/m.42382 type:complete len:241 (-) Transcript_13628:914-1636(-)